MGLLIWFVVGLVLAIVLTPTPKIQNAKASQFGDFKFPRSDYGDVAPLLWGRFRQDSPIVIWYGDFKTNAITKRVKTGMFSSKKQTTGYRYYFTIDMLVAMGPGVRLKKVWANNNKLVWSGDLSADGASVYINNESLFGGNDQQGGLSGTLRFHNGSNTAVQNSKMRSLLGPNCPNYNGFARVVLENFYIGTTAQPPTFHFELERIPNLVSGTNIDCTMPNGKDMNPIAAILDLFTNKWGSVGLALNNFDLVAFDRDAKLVKNEATLGKSQGFSQILQTQAKSEEIINEMLEHVDGILFEDPVSGKVTTCLLRQNYDAATLPIFNDENIVSISEMGKSTWSSAINRSRLTFRDRDGDYDENVAMSDDFALINAQSKISASDRKMSSVTDGTTAAYITGRNLSFANTPLLKMTMEVNRTGAGLKPGDVIRVNYTKGFAILNVIMRVIKVNLGTLTESTITLKLLQDRYSTHIGTYAAPGQSQFTPPSTAAAHITDFRLFTAPAFLAGQESTFEDLDRGGAMLALASRPTSHSQAFSVYADATVGGTYAGEPEIIGEALGYTPKGLLAFDYTAERAFTTRMDTTPVTIIGIEPEDMLRLSAATSLDSVRSGESLILINNEIFAYVNPVFDYELGSMTTGVLYRGIAGTAPQLHASGSVVWFIQSSTNMTASMLRPQKYFKLLDHTATNTLSLSDASYITETLTNKASLPMPPGNVLINGLRSPVDTSNLTVNVSWLRRSRLNKSLITYMETDSSPADNTSQVRVSWQVNGGSVFSETTTLEVLNITLPAGTTGAVKIWVVGSRPDMSLFATTQEEFTFNII